MGQGHRGKLHRVKGALIELKMAEVLQKREITHVHKISAQSEQLRLRYGHFYWFLEKRNSGT